MDPQVFNLSQIMEVLGDLDPVKAIEEGFVAHSQEKVTVPPVGELIFENPRDSGYRSSRQYRTVSLPG